MCHKLVIIKNASTPPTLTILFYTPQSSGGPRIPIICLKSYFIILLFKLDAWPALSRGFVIDYWSICFDYNQLNQFEKYIMCAKLLLLELFLLCIV